MNSPEPTTSGKNDPAVDHDHAARYPSLENRRVFITGGASGIGAAMVELFCRQGARVAFIDFDDAAAKALIGRLSDQISASPWFQQVDVTVVADLQASIDSAAEELGCIDVMINNVANDTRHDALAMQPDAWRACMAVNLDACFFAAQSAARIMQANQGGSIINLSSINALLGPAKMAGYVTAKAGVNGMTKALAKDFGPDNIRVNAILPGWVATDRQLDTWLTAEAEAEFSKHVAIKGRISSQDVARLALFLAADDSRMITGQCFTIDAGRT